MELELGLALPSNGPVSKRGFDLNDDGSKYSCKKRGFSEAFGMTTTTPLPLFMHEDDGDRNKGGDRSCMNQHNLNVNQRGLVGWPPIKCSRKRLARGEEDGVADTNGGARRGTCVKVKMEGVGIGRKVDLSLHHSYQSLLHTLNQMFPPKLDDQETVMDAPNQADHQGNYTVTYEDEDGDWLLVGDVPWQTFIWSVKRIKILG